MIEVERIGFCDQVRQRPDDKYDLLGYNAGRQIIVPAVPFVFRSTVLVQGFIEGGTESGLLELFLESENEHGDRAEAKLAELTTPVIGRVGLPLTFLCPVTLNIQVFGILRVRITLDGEDLRSTLFSVVQDNTPSN